MLKSTLYILISLAIGFGVGRATYPVEKVRSIQATYDSARNECMQDSHGWTLGECIAIKLTP